MTGSALRRPDCAGARWAPFDKHDVRQLAGYAASVGTPLFRTVAPRNWTVTLSATL